MSKLAKIGVIAGGCAIVFGLAACSSSDTTDTPASGTASAAATGNGSAAASATGKGPGSAAATGLASTAATASATASAKPATGSGIRNQPMGTTQVIKTTKFDAKVTLSAVTRTTTELGDAPYVVEARVQVTRGTYPAGTLEVQFIYANGSAHKQIEDPDGTEPAAELDAPSEGTFRFMFEHPAGAGVGQGARITISQDGKPLATWLT